MTMQIVIQVSGQPDTVIGVSEAAIKRARVSFNPSALPHVDNIKALAAALYMILDEVQGQDDKATAWQEAFTAAQLVQLGAMMAVSAATAHLVK